MCPLLFYIYFLIYLATKKYSRQTSGSSKCSDTQLENKNLQKDLFSQAETSQF